MPDFRIVIPARFASTRLPGKPLIDLGGKPIVLHVVEQAQASGAQSVTVATDNEDILQVVTAHGCHAVMTRSDHTSGTDRLAEVVQKEAWEKHEIIVNLQGDEPLMPPALIRQVAEHLGNHTDAAISTACHAIRDKSEMFDPNIVKVVTDRHGYALYFSRAAIPWARDDFAKGAETLPEQLPVYRHVGIYAYRASFLKAYAGLEPASIEQYESLEQLRALWHGYKISVAKTSIVPAAGIDTESDLQRLRAIYVTN